MIRHAVIIGNGVAGFSAARQLRREDADLTISIFSDEAHPFYLRSRLKDYIAGSLGDYEMILESRNLYRRERLSLFLQTPVVGLDVGNEEVILASGERVRYDRLLLAMGCAPARLDVPGERLRGVFSLRTLADARAIRDWALRHSRAVVLGEGIVSLQLAESLARMGAQVDYTLLGEHFWPDVLDPAASEMAQDLLANLGVRLHKRVRVARILGRDGAVSGVALEGGAQIPCDMVAHGCSFRPNTEILSSTPVTCAGGVVVNDHLETDVKGIFAAGDVIRFAAAEAATGPPLMRWRNSFHLGETAALNILGRDVTADRFAASLKTQVCGVSFAVIGRANLAEINPSVRVAKVRRGNVYRRLVFQDDLLVGAILVGDTSHATMLEQQMRDGTTRQELEKSLMPALLADRVRLKKPWYAVCPICTDRIALPAGALVGRQFACNSCRSRLKLAYSNGAAAIVPADD